MRRTRRRKSRKMYFQQFWDSCAQNKPSKISKKCTLRNCGTPVRRTRRRKSRKVHFQEFWDSCAQNKTLEISTNALSGIRGLLCAEQNIGKLNKCTFRNSGTPVRRTKRRKSQQLHFRNSGTPAQNKTSEILNTALSDIMGLWCAEQNVNNLKNCTYINYGTPARRTTRRKSQTLDVQIFWDSCAQKKTL